MLNAAILPAHGPVKEVHLVVGVLAIALDTAACLLRRLVLVARQAAAVWFWRLLRAGQVVVVIQVALGGVLLLLGKKASGLHVLYGRAAAAGLVHGRAAADQLGPDGARRPRAGVGAAAVGKLPEEEQHGVVAARSCSASSG